MLALFAVIERLLDFLRRRYVSNEYFFFDRRQIKRLNNFYNHFFRSAQNQNFLRLDLLNLFANDISVARIVKNRALHRADHRRLRFCRVPGDFFAVSDQKPIVNNRIYLVFLGYIERIMTFTGTAGTDKRIDFHYSLSPLIINFSVKIYFISNYSAFINQNLDALFLDCA